MKIFGITEELIFYINNNFSYIIDILLFNFLCIDCDSSKHIYLYRYFNVFCTMYQVIDLCPLKTLTECRLPFYNCLSTFFAVSKILRIYQIQLLLVFLLC